MKRPEEVIREIEDQVRATFRPEPPGPEDVWSHLTEESAPEEVAAADAKHTAWMASPAGQEWRAWEREFTAEVNLRLAV